MRVQEVPPLENSHWVVPGRLLAGEYPGGRDDEATRTRLRRLLDAGIDCFVDLTQPGETEAYDRWLPGPHGRNPVAYHRMPIRDHGLPESAAGMREILDEIDQALADGRRIYLHCRAGIGRTNLVAGCWLARSGLGGPAALTRLNELWEMNARSRSWPTIPETPEQADYVRAWREAAAPAADSVSQVTNTLQDRYRGMLLGLAIGDALGQATALKKPGSFAPVGDLLGGGPFDLPRGAWSDETAMALCLAESLVESGGEDAADQVRRYRAWQREGLWSSTGSCIGISAATARALAAAQWSRNPYAGSHDPERPAKEPLSRIGPAVAMLLAEPAAAIEAAVNAARVTHQAPVTLDAVRYLAALLAGALQGAPRAQLTGPMFAPVPGLWEARPLRPEVQVVAAGSWRDRPAARIFGGGQAVEALEAALWVFQRARNFKECVLAAVNLGGDADTTGAIVGQLAGAHWGATAILPAWRAALARRDEIAGLADRLLESGLKRIAR